MRKKYLLLSMAVILTGCANDHSYYSTNKIWAFAFSDYIFKATFVQANENFIQLKINILEHGAKEHDFYFKKDKYFSYVEVNNTKYNELHYNNLLGPILYENDEFFIDCYLSDKGKTMNYSAIDVDIYEGVKTLIITEKEDKWFHGLNVFVGK